LRISLSQLTIQQWKMILNPIDVLWVMSSRNGTVNNGTNEKVTKMAHFQYWGESLEFESGL